MAITMRYGAEKTCCLSKHDKSAPNARRTPRFHRQTRECRLEWAMDRDRLHIPVAGFQLTSIQRWESGSPDRQDGKAEPPWDIFSPTEASGCSPPPAFP